MGLSRRDDQWVRRDSVGGSSCTFKQAEQLAHLGADELPDQGGDHHGQQPAADVAH